MIKYDCKLLKAYMLILTRCELVLFLETFTEILNIVKAYAICNTCDCIIFNGKN